MARTEKETSSIIMPAFVGFIVGCAVALLLAPKRGDSLRQDFWDKVDEAEKYLDEELSSRGIS